MYKLYWWGFCMIRILLFYIFLLQAFDRLVSCQSKLRLGYREHRAKLEKRRYAIESALKENENFLVVLPSAHETCGFLERRFWFVDKEKLHVMSDVLAEKLVHHQGLSAYFMIEMYDFFESQDKDKFFTVSFYAKEFILKYGIFPEGFNDKYRYR